MINDTSTASAFLHSRRSTPAKTLSLPVPQRGAIEDLLRAAARSPDHGKLEPWRFIVLERAALLRLAEAVPPRGEALGLDADKIQKMRDQFGNAHLVIAVIGCPAPHPKIPEIEQILSAGAVCLALLNAGLASGWGANWLSGWASHDKTFVREHMDVAGSEFVAGLIHFGTPSSAPPERPRPDIDAKTTWATG